MIDNGGFKYFFESDWPHNPSYTTFSEAYRRIGKTEAGDAIEYAAKSFGIQTPERNEAFRNEFMEKQFGSHETEGEWTVEWDDCIAVMTRFGFILQDGFEITIQTQSNRMCEQCVAPKHDTVRF